MKLTKILRLAKRYLFLPLIFVPLAWALFGCAGAAVKEKVDQRLQSEAGPSDGEPLARASQSLILESPGLKEDQKTKLLTLHRQVTAEIAGMRQDLGKLKMLMFKSLINPESDPKEMKYIKDQIVKLDQKKTRRMFSALEEAQHILGRRSLDDERIYRAMMTEHSLESSPSE